MWFEDFGGLTHIAGPLWRSPMPEQPRHVRLYREAGIRHVVSFEREVDAREIERVGLVWHPHFWTDNAPPTREQMATLLADLGETVGDETVVFHCKAGWGRTGTAAACALVERGVPLPEALSTFWSKVPGSERIMRETGQLDFVHGWVASRAGRGL